MKKVFPEAIVIVHLDRGHKQSLYDWNLDIVRKYGGRWDMIGMSLYPYWAMQDHPELKADGVFRETMDGVKDWEEKVRMSRMVYNDTATKMNRLVRQFPSSLVAPMLGFGQKDYLTVDEPQKTKYPNINDAFKH